MICCLTIVLTKKKTIVDDISIFVSSYSNLNLLTFLLKIRPPNFKDNHIASSQMAKATLVADILPAFTNRQTTFKSKQ